MVNINRQIMLEGMRADFHKVDRLSSKVIDIVRNAKAGARDDAGRQRFHRDAQSDYRWLKTSGLISPDKWGNLPGGEVFTTPGEVNGTFVDRRRGRRLPVRAVRQPRRRAADAARQGQPAGRGASARTKSSRDDFWNYTHTDENSDRVGEFAIGTNIELKQVIGHILQDEKFPGIHIAFGNPTARTPAPTGTRRRTSTSSGPASTSGWTTARSCAAGGSWSRRSGWF